MKWPILILFVFASSGLAGCGFFGGDDEAPQDPPPPASQAAATDTAGTPSETPEEADALVQEPAPTTRTAATRTTTSAMDSPWVPTDTGTVDPGMTREQVIAVWGAPQVERASGTWVYMHYRNGCEITCGTDDVVFYRMVR